MRSRADRLRGAAEWALRAVALFALGGLLWRTVRPAEERRVEGAAADIGARLPVWTLAPPSAIHLALSAVPNEETRHWLRALRASGTIVRWTADRPLGAPVMVAEPVTDPRRPIRILVGGGGRIDLADDAGLIDTVSSAAGASLEVGEIAGALRATSPTFSAVTVPADSVVLRPVLVVGAAGWESKFVMAALEEAGWRVAARLRVAPGVEVTQEPLGAVDTARYSAVVALDSTASLLAPAIVAFVRSGGGLVVAGGGARVSGFAAIAPGRVVEQLRGIAGGVRTDAPRSGLSVFALASVRPDASPLERRGDRVAVAGRRVGAGRVVQSGYEDTWRWRMTGADDAVAAHREWWSRVVGSVAYAPYSPVGHTVRRDETPLASLVDVLGLASPLGRPEGSSSPGRATVWLFALMLSALLLEWASRRLRGAP